MVNVVSVDLGTQGLPGNMSVQQQGLDKSALNASSWWLMGLENKFCINIPFKSK